LRSDESGSKSDRFLSLLKLEVKTFYPVNQAVLAMLWTNIKSNVTAFLPRTTLSRQKCAQNVNSQ